MKSQFRPLPAVLAAVLVPSLVQAQTSYPMITHTHPVAVQRGKTTEVAVEGQQNFLGAYKVLIQGEGVAADVVPVDPPKATPPQKPQVRTLKLQVTASSEAMPGVREFRIATSLGVSSIGQILIVDDPVVMESASNNTPEKATQLQTPCVACGKIEVVEDVDYFKFRADAGQVFTFEVRCARLQDKIHDLQKHADPLLTLLDAKGRELAGSDDFYFADPMFAYRFEQAGDYFLQVRDSKYDGDPRWVYALTVTSKPYVSHVFPLAVPPGQTVEVEPVGSARLLQPKVRLNVPAAEPGIRDVQLDLGGVRTNPVGIVVSPLPPAFEQEPNDSPDKATRIAVPACVNGRIGTKGDLDHFLFAGKKGQAVRFEVKARRFGTSLVSGLDANLEILDGKGAVLATADDISPAIKDAALAFTPPADGDYLLRVRNLSAGKGGEHFVYAVEAELVAPDFTLRCDGDKAMIGPGSSTAWYVHVTRLSGFDGPVTVDVRGLPKGVTVNSLTIPPTMTQGLLVLTAAADALRDAANVQIVGTAAIKGSDGKEQTLTRIATPNQEIYFPGGGRGRFDVQMQTVAVTEKSDIELVEVSPAQITLKPGEEVKINVKLRRRPDYDGPVTLDVRLRHLGTVFGDPLPPGVTLEEGKSKTLLGKASEGHIVLKAAPNAAPIENVPVSVLAHVSINFVVKVSYSSPAIPLTVTGSAK